MCCQRLYRYPFLFVELAINQENSEWLRMIGLVLLKYFDLSIENNKQNNSTSSNMNRGPLIVQLPLNHVSSITSHLAKSIQPVAVHKSLSSFNGDFETPTSIQLEPNGKLFAYGTKSGKVTVVDLESMKVSEYHVVLHDCEKLTFTNQ